jgi:hypothetical protein
MLSRSRWIAAGAFPAIILLVSAAPPQDPERDARTRDHIKFLVTELDQWTSDLPQTYDRALVRPPVDAGALSEAGKAAADNLRDSIKRLTTLSNGQDIATNAAFREQLEKTLAVAKAMNEALGAQRFPQAIEGDWVPIRTNLNSLADIYKLQELAALEIPGADSPGGRKAVKAAAALPPGAVTGYIVDQRCAARGKGMWTNAQCVQTCVRDGDRVVLVTEEGKVFQIANQDKVDQDAYGQKVAVTGKTEGDAITVATLQTL